MKTTLSDAHRLALLAAHEAVGDRRFDEASRLSREVLNENSHEPDALNDLGPVALAGRQYPEALAMFKRFASLDDSDVLLFMPLGVVYAMSGFPQKAIEPIQRA